MREEERGCTARGTGVEVDGALGLISGSRIRLAKRDWRIRYAHT